MRYLFVALSLSLCSLAPAPAQAQPRVDIRLPGISIGINVPVYPRLVQVPGYPVYYAPRASSNYFFYDGYYWVYWRDAWYASSWYNGPWERVRHRDVPLYLLRVPVRYYRRPPSYFRAWRRDAAPRWGTRWGSEWEQSRTGWDQWDRRSVPAPAPLPVYQQQYSGNRYPRAVEQQQSIQSQNYRYQPREVVIQQPAAPPPQEIRREVAPPPQERRQERRQAAPPPQEIRREVAPPPPQEIRREAPPPPPQERPQVDAPEHQNRGQEKKAEGHGHDGKPPKHNKGQDKKDDREDRK